MHTFFFFFYIRTSVLCPPACTLDTISVQLGRLAVHPEVFRADVRTLCLHTYMYCTRLRGCRMCPCTYVRTYVCVCVHLLYYTSGLMNRPTVRTSRPLASQQSHPLPSHVSVTACTAHATVQCRDSCFFVIYCVILDALYTCKGTEG